MKKLLRGIKKFFGIIFLIEVFVGIYLSFTISKEYPIATFFTCCVFGVGAFLLLKPKKDSILITYDTPESYNTANAVISDITTHEPVPTTYVETENVIYRTDNKTISDTEIPHLQEIGREQAIARFKYSQYIRLIQESYQLIYNTIDPNILCDRYNFAKEKLDELNHYYEQGLLNTSTDLVHCNELLSDSNYGNLIIRCYQKNLDKAKAELKTQRGVENRISKFWKTIINNVDESVIRKLIVIKPELLSQLTTASIKITTRVIQ